jgi:antitoxin component YwqK of YwqJK toxin-antitoxin module
MKSYIYASLLVLACAACSTSPAPKNIGEYEVTAVKGTTNIEKAVRRDADGIVIEEGYLTDGLRDGVWITYYERGDRIQTLDHFVLGKREGYSLGFDTREQVNEKHLYENDLLNGPSIKFEFGRPVEEANYVDGQLHGIYKQYYRSGKLLKEVEFKNGVQDGTYRYYDEAGNLSLEYEYRNGEKISGGMVEDSGTE